MVGDLDRGLAGPESDVKMVLADDAALGEEAERLADHPLEQRLFHQLVELQKIGAQDLLLPREGSPDSVGGFCCPVPPEPR